MNESTSLNLLELEVMLRLLNQQYISYNKDNIHFVKDGALVGTISVKDYEKRIDNTPEQDADSIMAQAKSGQIVILVASAHSSKSPNVTTASFTARDDFKAGNYGKIFEDTFKSASPEAKEHCVDNCTTLNNPTFRRAVENALRNEAIQNHGQHNFAGMGGAR